MANWCNLRLVVTGHARDLAPFRRAAGALRGHIDTSRSTVFTEDMEYGEGGDLAADGLTRFDGDLRRAKYRFQGRNDDYVDHFRDVSRRYPRLAFILVVSDPNSDDNGSYLLRNGRRRWWPMPLRLHEKLFARHLRTWHAVPDGSPIDFDALDHADNRVDYAYWDAMFEGMDVAQAKWDGEVLSWLVPCRRSRGEPHGVRPHGIAARHEHERGHTFTGSPPVVDTLTTRGALGPQCRKRADQGSRRSSLAGLAGPVTYS